jgi:hypothetical protein
VTVASLLIIVSLIIIFAVDWVSHRQISSLRVEGNKFIPQDIVKGLVPDSLFKREKGSVKLNKIRLKVLEYPFIKSVNAEFGSNDDVVLKLDLRYPVVQIIDSSGKMLFADADKHILPHEFFDNFSHLPLLRNVMINGRVDSAALNFLVDFIIKLKNDNGFPLVYGLLSEIYQTKKNHYEARLSLHNAKVNFGDTSNFRTKIENLDSYLKHYYENLRGSKIEYIDLRWSRQVNVKLN